MVKIAYFGSDTFSILCLKQILPLYKSANPIISHIDVIAKSPKPSGRGLKELKDSLICPFAVENNINVLRADMKKDFEQLQKNNYELCIAVSYGKLIPSSFLSSLKYGGLNVHPSILPHLSGPAPMTRALLNGDQTTGVTIQTLHPSKFDEGDILKCNEYSIKPNETIESLTTELAISGGQLLKEILQEKLYDKSSPGYKILQPTLPYSYAGKTEKSERQINWNTDKISNILNKQKILGELFSFKSATKKSVNSFKRVVFVNLQASTAEHTQDKLSLQNGTFFLNDNSQLEIKVSDGFLTTEFIKVEGFSQENGSTFFSRLMKKFKNKDTQFQTV